MPARNGSTIQKSIFSQIYDVIAGHNGWSEAVTQTCFDATAIVGGEGSSE